MASARYRLGGTARNNNSIDLDRNMPSAGHQDSGWQYSTRSRLSAHLHDLHHIGRVGCDEQRVISDDIAFVCHIYLHLRSGHQGEKSWV